VVGTTLVHQVTAAPVLLVVPSRIAEYQGLGQIDTTSNKQQQPNERFLSQLPVGRWCASSALLYYTSACPIWHTAVGPATNKHSHSDWMEQQKNRQTIRE
jgi:hypothetical protein